MQAFTKVEMTLAINRSGMSTAEKKAVQAIVDSFAMYQDQDAQALAGPGAVTVSSGITNVTTTGVADALTLANGAFLGQLKVIHHAVDGGDFDLTPASFADGTSINSAAAGDTITLQWTKTGWRLVNVSGVCAIT